MQHDLRWRGEKPLIQERVANEMDGVRARRPSFEPPSHLREHLLQEEQSNGKSMDMEAESSHPKASRNWVPGKCIPQAPIALKYVIKSTRVGEHMQFMKDHALIGKFLGIWPSEKDLIKWIKHWWNPKGDYELQLSSKGFFTIIFYSLEDKDRVFENGPYFYNSAGLYLRFWTDRFSPEKEDFSCAPVWICLYSLPQEFWLEEILTGIGNTLGRYVKYSEATKQRKYTSYARICVYMNISKSLPGSVTIEYQDEEWTQTIDYEHIPFRCGNSMNMGISSETSPSMHQHGQQQRKHNKMGSPRCKGARNTQQNQCRRVTSKSQPKTPLMLSTSYQTQRRWKTLIK
jgi:hypothetical protein